MAMDRSTTNDAVAALLQQAMRCHGEGGLEEALLWYRRAIETVPDNFEALQGAGIACGQLGRLEEALRYFTQACSAQPGNAAAHFNRARALQALADLPAALAGYDRAIVLQPNFCDAYNNRGNVFKDLGRYGEAMADFQQAIALKPDFLAAHVNLGVVLLDLARHEEALACYQRVLSLQPDLAEAWNNRGNALKALCRFEEAAAHHQRAVALKPDYAGAWNNLGNAFNDLGRPDEAAAAYARAISLQPNYAEALFHLGLVKLREGDYEQGWRLHEWRWRVGGEKGPADLGRPLWLGESSPAGRTVLLHSEQGLGDTIQFARYVPMVEALGAKVILGVPAVLVSLLRTLNGSFSLISGNDALPAFDLHCPLMSLPLAFKTRVETIPAPIPYLNADPERRRIWRARLGDRRRPRIGVVWAGNPRNRNDHHRSMPLRHLRPLLALDCEFHALHKELKAEDRAQLAEWPQVISHEGELNDFAETAALIAELDRVITVDTGVAHLAGAMGKPLWIMLPFVADFRWLTERSDSPWYPTARLFRQRRYGDWDGVIAEIGAMLRAVIGG